MKRSLAITFVDRLGSVPRAERIPGAAKWRRHPDEKPGGASLLFVCPCGCGDLVGVNCSRDYAKATADGSPSWSWDGSRDAPTLKPSISRTAGCGWHGHLTRGVFTWE